MFATIIKILISNGKIYYANSTFLLSGVKILSAIDKFEYDY